MTGRCCTVRQLTLLQNVAAISVFKECNTIGWEGNVGSSRINSELPIYYKKLYHSNLTLINENHSFQLDFLKSLIPKIGKYTRLEIFSYDLTEIGE